MKAYIPYPIPSATFTWEFSRNEASAFASDIHPPLQITRLYDDACDVGIGIRSELTGKIAVFYLDKEIGNGEVKAWEFRPTPETVRDVPRLRPFRITIFND